jgi:predicted dehydrogenase
MIKVGIVGLGKMGLSHFCILNAHPDVNLCAICDKAKMLSWGLNKYSGVKTYSNYSRMIQDEDLDAVFIATPTRLHADQIQLALENNIHVFAEKPFCLDVKDSQKVTEEAAKRGLVTQVGYHNRFIGTFIRAKEIIDKGYLGKIYHIEGSAFGPVVTKKQKESWRTQKSEGGGCLYDYSAHVINLMEYYVGKSTKVENAILQKIYSTGTEDAVFADFLYPDNLTGRVTVDWTDETYRKMVTSATVYGEQGKLIVNSQELKVYLKNNIDDAKLVQGWNVSWLTDHSLPVNFYLRGEEYSAQIDSFVEAVINKDTNNKNSFRSALDTDLTIAEIFDVAKQVG